MTEKSIGYYDLEKDTKDWLSSFTSSEMDIRELECQISFMKQNIPFNRLDGRDESIYTINAAKARLDKLIQVNQSEQSSGELIHKNFTAGKTAGGIGMNSNVVIIGKVCKGFEARDAGDKKVGRFSVVVNTGKQDAEGKDVGAFYEIESWNDKQHDAYRDFVKVGDLVAVKGNLSIDTYEKSDGGKGTSLKIKNPDVTFLGQAKSPGMATITAVGRLTRDVETKELDGGKKVANFTVAANDGGKEDSANFLNVELWNDRTKAAEFLQKGSLISVSGKLNIDTYEKSDGGKGISAKISNPEIVFLDKKREDGGKAPAEFDKIKAPAANKSAGNSK